MKHEFASASSHNKYEIEYSYRGKARTAEVTEIGTRDGLRYYYFFFRNRDPLQIVLDSDVWKINDKTGLPPGLADALIEGIKKYKAVLKIKNHHP